MSTLQENVDIIKAQVARMKTALGVDPTTPLEEVTTTIEQGGGSSAKSNIYKVATIEERDAITNAVEGDMCVVHNSIIENVTVDSKFQIATFPDTVVLDTAITDFIDVRYRSVDTSKMFDCWGSLDSSGFNMDCYTEEGSIRIQYTSSDGITYTRTDTTGNSVDFGTEICFEYEEMWNDAIGEFIQIKGISFEGLFEFQHELKTILKDRNNNEYYVTGIPFCNMNTSCLEIIYDYEFDRKTNRISKFKSLMLMGGSYLSNVNDYVYIENNNLYGHSNLDNNANDTYRYDFTSYNILDGDHRLWTDGAIENKTLLIENVDIDKLMIIIPKSYVTTEQCIYSDVNKTSKIISATATPSTTNNLSWNYSDINIPLVPNNVYKDNNAYTNYGVITGTIASNTSADFDDMDSKIYAEVLEKYDTLDYIVAPADASRYFDHKNLYTIPIKSDCTPLLDTSNVTKMYLMFTNCESLLSIPLIDTKNVTDMTYMFYFCRSLKTIPLLDTSNVTNMQYMFYACSKLKTIPLINTNKVTSMKNMFCNCESLETIPQLDTSNVTDMEYMFGYCHALTEIPLINTGKVTKTRQMFCDCKLLETIPLLDTSNVVDMCYMFQHCTSLKGIPLINTNKATAMMYTFYDCTSLETIPQLDTSNVEDVGHMFQDCTSLTSIPQLDTSSVKHASNMFCRCTSLTEIPLLNTSNAINIQYMFGECTSLVTIPLLDTHNVTIMYNAFSSCPALSDESLNNILAMAKNSKVSGNKTTTYIGLSAEQKERIKSLSNYSAFISAGWSNN